MVVNRGERVEPPRPEGTRPEEDAPALLRGLRMLITRGRPALGWSALLTAALLVLLPALGLRANRWLNLGSLQGALAWSGPLALAVVWWLLGWGKALSRRRWRRRRGWVALPLFLLCGVVVVMQLTLAWLPGPGLLLHTAQTGAWAALWVELLDRWLSFGRRMELWSQGVMQGGAAQDNLIFAVIGASVLWLLGGLTGWLLRRTGQGYVAAAPSLWLLGFILLYSSSGRYLLLLGLALTVALHTLLEQAALVQRWQALRLDYSPSVLTDRLTWVVGATLLLVTLAAVMPNLYITPLVTWYYGVLAPVNARVEALGERLFPDLRATSRLRGGGGDFLQTDQGLPNALLLQGGPSLSSAVIMRVRTDETPVLEFPFDELAAPPGHAMRGRTFAIYNGRGWANPLLVARRTVNANGGGSPRPKLKNEQAAPGLIWGRKPLGQSVVLEVTTTQLFAAGELVEASVDYARDELGAEELIAAVARVRSYSAVSLVPAVDEGLLRGLPLWGDDLPLPEEMARYLELPPSVTPRTRELAASLRAERGTLYDQAQAIEQYLRQFTYDLEVDAPPAGVSDVADYFLFDLQRGYCDYYATAFVVLARLNGLPTRFASGFAPGQWDPQDEVWVITEADAHSWPEVYFPQIGWVAFEPTAGRPLLTRMAAPEFRAGPTVAATLSPALPPLPAVEGMWWDWQMLVWLLPLGALGVAVVMGWRWWRQRREDPWLAVLRWGQRRGRPMQADDTVLEYGQAVAGALQSGLGSQADAARVAAREVVALSQAVSDLKYGDVAARTTAAPALLRRWQRLRGYLRMLR